MTKTHTVPAGTIDTPMTAAFKEALGQAAPSLFEFNLLDTVTDLHSKGLKDRLLSKVAFACDAYIGITLQRKLSAMKESHELLGTQPWDSYQAFRNYVSGIAASEQTMAEAGMEVKETRVQLQRLFNMRTACHDAIATIRGAQPMSEVLVGKTKDATIYAVPDIEKFFRNPRLRQDDLNTTKKREGLLKGLASNDDGVVDADLLAELQRSYQLKSEHKRNRDLDFDRQRGELTAMMFRAFNLTEYGQAVEYSPERPIDSTVLADGTTQVSAAGLVSRAMGATGEVSPVDPFGDLDIETKYRLLHGMVGRDGRPGYIKSTLADAIDDWNVDFEEHAKWVIEARPLTKAVRTALDHPIFASVNI